LPMNSPIAAMRTGSTTCYAVAARTAKAYSVAVFAYDDTLGYRAVIQSTGKYNSFP